MIAVFAESGRIFGMEIHAMPKSEFKLIRSVDDIRGIKFSGVILYHRYYENTNVCIALDVLKNRQPELFMKI